MDIASCEFVAKNFNSIDIRLGIHGYVHADREWKSNGMTIPYSKLYYIFSGSAVLECGSEIHTLTPEYVYLVPYGAHHSFHCNNNMEKLFFHFTVIRSVGGDIFENVKRVLKLPADHDSMDHIKQLYFSEDIGSCIALKKEIYSCIIDFIDGFGIEAESKPAYSETVAGAVSYIRENLSQSIRVKELADALFVSESMLSKRFAKETGVSVGKFVDREVITEAQRRLLLSDEPIQRISESLGFCDQFYFSKKFKQFCGISPVKYRKESRDGI